MQRESQPLELELREIKKESSQTQDNLNLQQPAVAAATAEKDPKDELRQKSESVEDRLPKEIPTDFGEKKLMSITDALVRVGSQGLYQITFFLFSGFVWLFGASAILATTFTFEKPGYSCPSEVSSDNCESWVCSQPNPSDYFSTHPESFVMSFDPPLICGRQNLADMSIAINYAGSAIGFVVSLYVADNKGRKLGTIIFWVLAALGCFIAAIFGFNIGASVFGFALSGFGANSAINIVICMMNDHSLGKFREYTMASLNAFYGVGGIILVLMVEISPHFRWIMVCIGLPIIVSCLYTFFIVEPPLFIYEKSKEAAIRVLNYIAKINRRPKVAIEELEDKPVQGEQSRIYGIRDLFMYPSLRYNAICSGLVLFFVQISYFGSNLILSQIGLDTKTNALTTSAADTFGYAAFIPLAPFIRRKRWAMGSALIFSVIFICFPEIKVPDDCNDSCGEKKLQTALVTIARFFLTFEWGVAFILITEVFPTTVRTIGLGFASCIGYLGSVFCSYFLTYLINQNINPVLGIGIVSIASLVFYLPLSETYQVPIQNEIKELLAEEIKKEKEKAEKEKLGEENEQDKEGLTKIDLEKKQSSETDKLNTQTAILTTNLDIDAIRKQESS